MYDAFCVGNTICNPPGREGSQACATTSGRQASTAAHAVHGERRQSMSPVQVEPLVRVLAHNPGASQHTGRP